MKKILATLALLLTTVFLFTACAKLALPKDLKKTANDMAEAYDEYLTENQLDKLTRETADSFVVLSLFKKADPSDKNDPSDFDFSMSGNGLAAHIAKATIAQHALGGTFNDTMIKTMLDSETNNGDGWNLLIPAYTLTAATLYNSAVDATYNVDKLIGVLLSKQKENGGFSSSEFYDVDSTAIIMTALSLHKNKPGVSEALDKGVAFLASVIDEENFAFKSTDDITWGEAEINSCSTSQAIIALISCGIDPFKDSLFCSKEKTMFDFLMTLKRADNSMAYSKSQIETADWSFSTPQTLLAFGAALKYSETGKHLYDFS